MGSQQFYLKYAKAIEESVRKGEKPPTEAEYKILVSTDNEAKFNALTDKNKALNERFISYRCNLQQIATEIQELDNIRNRIN